MTPGAWLQFLEAKLDAQVAAIADPDAYYNGEQRLAFATAKFKEAFARYFPPLANNWCKLVVDTPAARLQVMGFRFDPDPNKPTWELAADADAWTIWQASNMDSTSGIVHTDAIKYGVSYALVSPPGSDDDDLPPITAEHPSQSYVYVDPANRLTRLAALKRWTDEIDGYAYATVYLPAQIAKWRSVEPVSEGKEVSWQRRADDPGGSNPIGVVPMIPIENKPDLIFGGRSDLEEAIPIQDAVNKLCLDMQVSSEFHAYPQRFATGWQRSEDAEGHELTNRQVEMYASQTRLWRASSADTNFGQLSPGDVNNYIQPISMYIDHLAAVTQTPAYYLKGQMANLSADALHAADAGLVDRCWRKINNGFSDAWEEVMRTTFLARGDLARGKATSAETIWKDPERRSLSQLVDAAVKMRQVLSVPLEMCWELLGWSPEQIRQARDMMNLPAAPGVPRVLPPSDPNALVVDPTAPGGLGKASEAVVKLGAPEILGPDGKPIAASAAAPGAVPPVRAA